MKHAIFDLDMTLFRTPSPIVAELINNNESLPLRHNANNWWKSPQSLSPNLNIPAHDLIIKYAQYYYNHPNYQTILITHRDNKLRPNLLKLLNKFNINFNEIIMTFEQKDQILLEYVPEILNTQHVTVFEDGLLNIYHYKQFFDKNNINYKLLHLSVRHLIEIKELEIGELSTYEMKFV